MNCGVVTRSHSEQRVFHLSPLALPPFPQGNRLTGTPLIQFVPRQTFVLCVVVALVPGLGFVCVGGRQ